MRRLILLCACIAVCMSGITGCAGALNEKLQKARDSSYEVNKIVAQVMVVQQELCDAGWNSKFDEKDNDIDVAFAQKWRDVSKDWVDDGKGTVKAGTTDAAKLYVLMTQRDEGHKKVAEARKKYQADRAKIVPVIEAFKDNNDKMHQKETDAYEALKSAQELANKALTALGVVAGAAAGAGAAAAF